MKKLDLSGLKLSDDQMLKILQSNGGTLTNLVVNGCEKLTNKSIGAIGEHCRSLLRLGVEELYGVTPDAITNLFASANYVSGLEEVSLNRTYANDDTVVALAVACGSSLRKLGMHSLSEITDMSLVALTKFSSSNLQEIELSFCRKFTDDGLGQLVDSCPRIRRLDLWGCTQVTDRFYDGHSATDLII